MKTIDLCGTWHIKGSSGDRGGLYDWPRPQPDLPVYEAKVPGTVQEALEFVTGNVLYAHNCLNARFIEECKWLWTRTFTLTEEEASRSLRLVFERLDLTAEIWLNGVKIGEHHNFYVPCRLNITGKVRAGENQLDIILDSGLFEAADKPTTKNFGGGANGALTKRIWLRKPQSSFEWDWSPRIINVGIPEACYIEVGDGIFPDHLKVQASLTGGKGIVKVTRYLDVQKPGLPYRVTARIPETGATAEASGTADKAGILPVELTLTVENPEKWYPRGYGAQRLYEVEVTVSGQDTETTVKKKTGFREVVVDQSPHPVKGKYFRLFVNGLPFFAKGGNLVPADVLFSRLTGEVYRTLVDRAMEANFNLLRVWGGGLYESEALYELCDEKGLLVWQDMVNACANYPGTDNDFYRNYVEELTWQVRRLAVHPSLIIYAGNNEIDWMNWCVESQELNKFPDCQLYYWVIPRLLRDEGETRYYQPSSPYSDDDNDGNSDTSGDQHPWGVGFENENYFDYRRMVCRFPNEGGVLGPTSLPNTMLCFGEGQDYFHSFDWQVHENSISDTARRSADRITKEHLNLSMTDMTVADYVYYGGFCQGEGFTEYILNFRRRMPSSASAVFWMMNDCWPAVRSWTIVDYLRNRTPSFHPVRRAFAPVTVDIVRENGKLTVYAISERTEEKKGTLEYGAFLPDGSYVCRETKEITLPAHTSLAAAELQVPENAIPYAVLKAEGEPIARRRLVEKPYYQLGLTEAPVTVTKEGDETVYICEKPTLGVCIDLDGADNAPEDNYFDLYPGQPWRVRTGHRDGKVLYAYQGESKPRRVK